MPENGQIDTQMPRDLVEEQIATIANLSRINAALLAALEQVKAMLQWSLHDKICAAEHRARLHVIEMATAAITAVRGTDA